MSRAAEAVMLSASVLALPLAVSDRLTGSDVGQTDSEARLDDCLRLPTRTSKAKEGYR